MIHSALGRGHKLHLKGKVQTNRMSIRFLHSAFQVLPEPSREVRHSWEIPPSYRIPGRNSFPESSSANIPFVPNEVLAFRAASPKNMRDEEVHSLVSSSQRLTRLLFPLKKPNLILGLKEATYDSSPMARSNL